MPGKDTNLPTTVETEEDEGLEGQAPEDVTEDDTVDDVEDAQDDQGEGQADGGAAQGQGGKPGPKGRQPKQATPAADPDDPAAGLKKALQAERTRARGLDKELKELRLKHASAEERVLLEAREQAAAEAAASTRTPLVKALAAMGLQAAGVQTGIEKLVGLLDLDKVELDEGGEVIGLSEQIDELKETFPGVFAVATGTAPPRVPNANGGAGAGTGRKKDREVEQTPKGFAQILADQVTGAQSPGIGMAHR
jgi:hypothetical protein